MKYGKYKNLYLRLDRIDSKKKKYKSRERDYYFASHNRSRDCFYSSCSKQTIHSHIISQAKHLDLLGEGKNKNVFELYYSPFNSVCKFRPTFVRNSLQFQGFCREHDYSIFKSIENEDNINHSDYQNQLKHYYRALLYEARKKEVRIEISIQLEKDFPGSYYSQYALKTIEIYSRELEGIYYLKEIIEKELVSNTDKKLMTFHSFEISRIDLAASIIYGKSISNNHTNHCMHILPEKDKTTIIFGYMNIANSEKCEDYYQKLYSMSELELKKVISDTLILYSESFVISPTLFKVLSTKKISQLIQKYLHKKPETINFNMFNNIANIM